MTEVLFTSESVRDVKGKVVVMTGGAQGIGAATVTLLYNAGAHVYFGDWDDKKGTQLVDNLRSTTSESGGSVHFQKLDVRDYKSQLQLFQTPYAERRIVDVAISCAAVTEPSGWFQPDELDLETVKIEPQPLKDAVDINLTSVISFCRIALAFMKQDDQSTTNGDGKHFSKSIVLVSSIAGIVEQAGLFSYGAAKHGVIGLMRSLRAWAPAKFGVRVNAVCPWATDTQLMDSVRSIWVGRGLPINTPAEVGQFILQCAVDGELNGRSVLVGGGKGYDTEAGIDKTLPQWMGVLADDFYRGQEALGMVSLSVQC
ncbi:NAD(P)-binding protein [Sarocladium strictum]